MGVINFVEKQRSVQLYDYLIFVCGVDISAYVEDLTVYYQDRAGHGSADIVLSNPFDQWVLTPANLRKSFRTTSDRYTEMPKKKIFEKKRALSTNLVINKKSNYDPTYSDTFAQDPTDDPNYFKNLQGAIESDFLSRYNFGPGTCVFSRFDTVKIFIKNPSDPSTWDRWIPAFTGTIENKPFNTDYVSGKSTISLHAYDIRATMQGMRVGVNPVQNAMFKTNSEAKKQTVFFDSDAAGFFKDFYPDTKNRGAFDNIFEGLSFVDMMGMVITGYTGWINGGIGTSVKNGEGIGFFQPGNVIRYGNAKNTNLTDTHSTNLESWDNLCLFGVGADGGPRNEFLTESECKDIGTHSFWTEANSPMNGKMHFLIPSAGLQVSDMIISSVKGLSNIMSSPDWTNRYALVTQICQQVDYEWNVTGSGDIIFEFPMYDFYPEDFGSNKSFYKVTAHLTTDEISDEGGEVIAGLEASSLSPDIAKRQQEQSLQQTAQGVAVPGAMRAVVVNNLLASKYGAKIASVSFTGVRDQTALEKLALIEFNKRLADSNKLSMNFSPIRPWLRPNRPVKHGERNRVGKTTSVRLNFPSLREPTISIAVNNVKLPIIKDGQIAYTSISGGQSSPLSYNAIFENPATLGNPDSGTIVMSMTTKDQQK